MSEPSIPTELILSTRAAMIAEAKDIIDDARARGLTLRLVGGLAVRLHCRSLDFCERDHGDIDLVGHRRDTEHILAFFRDLGYEEVFHVRQATSGGQLQFSRKCRHGDEWGRHGPHLDDHVDVFLDTFRMEHALELRDRLERDDYTVTVSDMLITKLQMNGLTEKDERDIFTLLGDLELGTGDEPAAIDLTYIAGLCAKEWGLYNDVTLNLERLQERLDAYQLTREHHDRIAATITRLKEAITAYPKSRAWRARARIGTRLPWHETVEEQD